MYDVHFFILIAVAAFNLIIGLMMNTTNFYSMMLFKFTPIVGAFALALIAFKVI